MNYINFAVLTDTPVRFRNFLINRGVITETTDREGNPIYVGARGGMEWVEVPNPIITTPAVGEQYLPDGSLNPDYVPAVHDTRRVFLVKFSSESAQNEVDGETTRTITVMDPRTGEQVERVAPEDPFNWSRFGKWVKNNSTVVTAPSNYTINGEPVGDAYKINGENVWLVKDNPERFGVWQ